MLCVVTEDTRRAVGERRLRTLRELAARTTETARSAADACTATARTLADDLHDLTFVLVYLLDAGTTAFRPDVVFMDIGMPVLNGHEACRRIR